MTQPSKTIKTIVGACTGLSLALTIMGLDLATGQCSANWVAASKENIASALIMTTSLGVIFSLICWEVIAEGLSVAGRTCAGSSLGRMLLGTICGGSFALACGGFIFSLVALAESPSQICAIVRPTAGLDALLIGSLAGAIFFLISWELIRDAWSYVVNPDARRPYRGS